ncbi:MAG: hypothetical protein FWH41_04010 [Treponema sp.]|nr:hypothetical protein [Treponema sp.]
MKKKFILGLAILPLIGLVLMTCAVTDDVFRWKLTLPLDKTEARVGDTVTATVVYKNTNYDDMDVGLSDWIVEEGGKRKEDMLRVIFTTEKDDDIWKGIPFAYSKAIRFKIKKNEEIKKTFSHTITAEEDLYVYAAAIYHWEGRRLILRNNTTSFPNHEKITIQKEQ